MNDEIVNVKRMEAQRLTWTIEVKQLSERIFYRYKKMNVRSADLENRALVRVTLTK